MDTTADYRSILRDGIPVIDVRASAEFGSGAIPSAINLPILTDDERARVGIQYRNHGQQAAIDLGLLLVSGETKQQRIQRWCDVLSVHPDARICCWRGGLRSEMAQRWLAESGWPAPRIEGGSKALRAYCLDILDQAENRRLIVIGGRTGVGKTKLLERMPRSIDLEALARHRGSAFGALTEPQPVPVSFENALAAQILQHESASIIAIEDESRRIGRLAIPEKLFAAMQKADLVVVDAPIERRVQLTFEEYVSGSGGDSLRAALARTQKRLGGLRYRELDDLMKTAYESNSQQLHFEWIRRLLQEYYDPMYDYQLEKKTDRIAYRGNFDEVSEYVKERLNSTAS